MWLAQVQDEQSRTSLAELVADGARTQARDPRFRRELASWMRSNTSSREDGLPGYSIGLGNLMSRIAPFFIGAVNWGSRQALVDRKLVMDAPALFVLWTVRDEPRAWLGAGQALDRALLTAASAGVSAGFMNQPVQCPELRESLRSLNKNSPGFAQAVIRLGYARAAPLTKRRSVAAVVS